MGTYIPFHMHSDYSLLDSCTKYQDYIDLAVRDGAKAISISEHGKPLNWTEKWGACKKAGIKYIHSVEIYMTESLTNKIRDNYHTVLMAKNMDGLLELNALVSKSCDKEHFYYTNRISFDEFLNISDNIISTSACLASPLNKLPDDHPRYLELANKYTFLEIQPHIHPDQVEYNKRLVELSKKIDKPLIAGTDTHSSTQYKAECRAVLMSAKRKSYGDEDAFDLTYKTYDELVDMFERQNAISKSDFMQAIENTNLLDEMTEEIELDLSIKYPILYGSREADEAKFIETIETMFDEKVANGIIPEKQIEGFRQAIDEELRVFKKLDMCGFMLSMSELITWCKKQGFAIGTARGSVGGSRIAYITDIIDLNPEQWNTVFSRFANETRVEPGDIDIDCVESDRPSIFNYIVDRFGADRTARVASFGTIKDKGVIDDVGRHLSIKWDNSHPNDHSSNPWSLAKIAKIKSEYDLDADKAVKKYPELFYYMDGLINTKVSQSVHPAGMVIAPMSLNDNYGIFDKDNENCMMLDMDNVHDYAGCVKYDFLVLTTVQIIRDTCNYIGKQYPRTHEIDWDDSDVWESMSENSFGIFQMEGDFAFNCMKTFRPKSIFDMSLVTACIRPSGSSYRDALLKHIKHTNPSNMIDELLKDNLGYLVYQEDTIKFLQQICGLSGSESDNIRRAIGRKQKDKLDAALPSILDGYCNKSTRPRHEAENEAKEFLQIIEDSAEYQFGYNHAVAYCLLGYMCAYLRYYHPIEFITSYLNNAANDGDIRDGVAYAQQIGIKVLTPKFGVSKGEYYFSKEKNSIAKGTSSVKYIGAEVAEELYSLASQRKFTSFIELLIALDRETSLKTNQLDILIKIDFFSDFGNQRELLIIADLFYNTFSKGNAKQVKKSVIDGTNLQPIVEKYAVGVTKSGGSAKNYTLLDVTSILEEAELAIKKAGYTDLDDITKVRNFQEAMGYAGYTTNKEEDRKKLLITDLQPLKRKTDRKQFGYSVFTKSLGSGKEARMTVFNKVYDKAPFKTGDLIRITSWVRDGKWFTLTGYKIL